MVEKAVFTGRAIGEARRRRIALTRGDRLIAKSRDHHVGRGRAIEILVIAELARGKQDQDDGDEPHDATPLPAARSGDRRQKGESVAKVNKWLILAPLRHSDC